MASLVRLYILFAYSCIGIQWIMVWFIFGSITCQTQAYYHLSTPSPGSLSHQIAIILNLGPFLFLLLSPCAAYLLRYPVIGFQYSMKIAAISSFIAMLVICLPTILSSFKIIAPINGSFFNTVIFLYIGAAINSIASPLILSSPAKLSVMWFPKRQRNTITACASMICYLGQCAAYFAPPLLVPNTQPQDMPRLLYSVLCLTFCISAPVVVYFPAHPKKFPTLASKISTLSSCNLFAQSTIEKNKSLIVNVNNCSDINSKHDDIKSPYPTVPFMPPKTYQKNVTDSAGTTRCIGTDSYTPLPFPHSRVNLFASDFKLDKKSFKEYMKLLFEDWKQVLNVKENPSCLLLLISGGLNMGATSGWSSILQDMISPIGLDQTLIGYIGASLLLGQVIGGCIGGVIVDKYFEGQLKKCILILQFADIIWYCIAFLLLPNCLLDGFDTVIVVEHYATQFVIVLLVCVAIGLNFGMLAPLYLELLAEIAFPVAETSTTNLLMCISIPTMMIIIAIGSINTSFDTPIALLLVIVAFIVDCFVVEKYKRPTDELV